MKGLFKINKTFLYEYLLKGSSDLEEYISPVPVCLFGVKYFNDELFDLIYYL